MQEWKKHDWYWWQHSSGYDLMCLFDGFWALQWLGNTVGRYEKSTAASPTNEIFRWAERVIAAIKSGEKES